MTMEANAVTDIVEARTLAVFGDSITTDHISPAGSIKASSPAGHYLTEHGVDVLDFNSYGARRGNHEVMMRGTFANIRIRNKITPEIEGGMTRHFPSGEVMSIYDAAMRYQAEGRPLIVFAGKEYGTGSSRDWAAKGTRLLGVRAVIAESYERIHRSNLVGMGVVPLQFKVEGWAKLNLTGEEIVTIRGLTDVRPRQELTVELFRPSDGRIARFPVRCRIDTETELEYFQVRRRAALRPSQPRPRPDGGGVAAQARRRLPRRRASGRARQHRLFERLDPPLQAGVFVLEPRLGVGQPSADLRTDNKFEIVLELAHPAVASASEVGGQQRVPSHVRHLLAHLRHLVPDSPDLFEILLGQPLEQG
jgi:3-isopropylmalate dehydratase small subunit